MEKLSTRRQPKTYCVTVKGKTWELNLANCTAKEDEGKIKT